MEAIAQKRERIWRPRCRESETKENRPPFFRQYLSANTFSTEEGRRSRNGQIVRCPGLAMAQLAKLPDIKS